MIDLSASLSLYFGTLFSFTLTKLLLYFIYTAYVHVHIQMYKYVCVCVCVCVWAELFQSCLTPCDPMDCNLPGSSVHGSL